MSKIVKLNEINVKKLKYKNSGPNVQVVFDKSLPGFGVRLYPNSTKSWVIYYRVNQIRRMSTLGKVGTLLATNARKKAIEILNKASNGIDPVLEKRKEKENLTFRRLCDEYLTHYSKQHKKTWKEDQRRINKLLPKLGSKYISNIKKIDITQLHQELSKTAPIEANNVLRLISSMYNFAIDHGYYSGTNPASRIRKNKHKPRDRWVTPEEMPKLLESIDAEPDIFIKTLIMLYLYTGARKNELMKIKWEQVNLENGEIKLPDTKAGRIFYIQLSKAAIEILKDLPRLVSSPYVFPGSKPGKPRQDFRRAWKRIRENAGLPDVTIHDLRRTFCSYVSAIGYSSDIAGDLLNQSDKRTTRNTYQHFHEKMKKDVVNDLSEFLETYKNK